VTDKTDSYDVTAEADKAHDDKWLADQVVALGVGKANQIYPDGIGKFYQVDVDADWQTSVNEAKFVRDWRVAGAIMELCAKRRKTIALSFGPEMFCATGAGSSTPTYGVYLERSNESAPRAIIEAGVEYIDAD